MSYHGLDVSNAFECEVESAICHLNEHFLGRLVVVVGVKELCGSKFLG